MELFLAQRPLLSHAVLNVLIADRRIANCTQAVGQAFVIMDWHGIVPSQLVPIQPYSHSHTQVDEKSPRQALPCAGSQASATSHSCRQPSVSILLRPSTNPLTVPWNPGLQLMHELQSGENCPPFWHCRFGHAATDTRTALITLFVVSSELAT